MTERNVWDFQRVFTCFHERRHSLSLSALTWWRAQIAWIGLKSWVFEENTPCRPVPKNEQPFVTPAHSALVRDGTHETQITGSQVAIAWNGKASLNGTAGLGNTFWNLSTRHDAVKEAMGQCEIPANLKSMPVAQECVSVRSPAVLTMANLPSNSDKKQVASMVPSNTLRSSPKCERFVARASSDFWSFHINAW